MKEYPSIDQQEISNTIKDFISFLKSILLFIFYSIKRFFIVFLLLFIFIAAAGYYFKKEANLYFTADMACSYNYLHKKTYGEMIYRANYLAATHSYGTLAEEMNISLESAKKIIALEAKNIAGSPLHEDITEAQLPIYISAIVSQKNAFPVLQEGILYYFNNRIPYQQKRSKLETERLAQNISSLSSSIGQIDRLIDSYTNKTTQLSPQADSTSVMLEISKLIQQKTQLNNQMQSDQKMLGLQISVELLYGFAPTEYPNLKTGIPLHKIILFAFLFAWGSVIFLHLLLPKKSVK